MRPVTRCLTILLIALAAAQGARAQTRAVDWAALGTLAPLEIQRGPTLAGPTLAVDAADPQRIAYCAANGVRLSDDGGATWTRIPLTGIARAARAAGYPLLPAGAGGSGACVSLVLDSIHPDSLFVTVVAGKAPYGAPPLIFLGFATADRGQSWQPVPVPDGASIARFGGFRHEQTVVQALFGDSGGAAGAPTPLRVEETDDGANAWDSAILPCPLAGPCVRFGPAPNGIGSCAMNAHRQPVLVSANGGQTWSAPAGLQAPNGCDLLELAALSPSSTLLLSGRAEAPLQRSTDGGLSWAPIALPPLPGSAAGFFAGLQLLPDGSLLAQGDGGQWYRLLPAATRWCQTPQIDPQAAPGSVRVSGANLWWLPISSAGTLGAPASVPLASLTCG